MLLKKKKETRGILDDPTMLMKTNDLVFRGHDVYEK